MRSRRTVPVRLLTALLLGAPSGAWAVADHLPSADKYMAVLPANNEYLLSSQGGGILTIDAGGAVTNKTVCGAFVARVFKNQWPELTQTVMQGLFGGPNNDASQGLPNSAHWYDAIDLGWTYTSGGTTYSLAKLATWVSGGASQLQPGMVLVSKYANSGDATGHTMLVRGSAIVANPANPPAGTSVTLRVNVWDSTKSEHTTDDDAPAALKDSRVGDDPGGAFDQGAGTGYLNVFIDTAGHPVGWTWGIRANVTVNTATILAGTFRW